ncbi:glycine/D-amino acid oxidase-like deaminating enzyme [Kribbella amoyensis]|uniref:Glycine/D-amino acid oxidase-like deaminating enzyme n=1 Tax=Kribbella amoyensis TaxID=996641 RepID=A0A561BUI9_9ACTN|nr:FAD-dependent oxidoreductase [Kribbella amoyensis]TWD82463.1 glycine/D-amino acid oxidase-like deaminating enzyme [Kribbella amoyensis]
MTDHGSVWLATAALPEYPALRSDDQAEVVVIGGGLIGLTTALYLAQDGASVVLLEARRLAGRTSGNTTGKVTSQHGAIYADLLDRHGEEKTRTYANANQVAVDEVAALVDRLGIECELTRTPSYVYSTRPENTLRREADVAASLGLPATFVDPAEVGVPARSAVRFTDQVQLHPVRYLAGLARSLTTAGGRIYEHSRVLTVDDHADGVQVSTEDGHTVKAQHAVVATLLPINVTGAFFARTRPSQSHGIALTLPVAAPAGMAISVDAPTRSTRPWPGGGPNGLIVVGGDHETGDGTDTEAAYRGLADWAGSLWNFAARPAYRWSAQDYGTPDLLPYVGRSPGSKATSVATGMHKWGLTNGTVAAGILRDLVIDRANPFAALYGADRIGDAHSVAKLVKDNLKVGKEFTAGHLGHALHGKVKPVCTHLGCPLHWNEADRTWDCNCHGSRFGATGEVLDGPATKPLPIDD